MRWFLLAIVLTPMCLAQDLNSLHLSAKTMSVNFKNTNIDTVINYYIKETNVTIIKDPKIKTNISIFSNSKFTHAEAFDILFKTLKLSKIDSAISDGFVILTQSDKKKIDLSQFKFPEPTILKTHNLKYANAMNVANILNSLFTNNTNYFKASADIYSNVLLINTTNDYQEQARLILVQLDIDRSLPMKTNVLNLKYAEGAELSGIISNVLTQLDRTGQFNVSVDSRTNSLIVSCREDQVENVKKIVSALDQKSDIVDNTIILKLKNANSENINQILQSIFGNRRR
jgi:general secretion pathway protein D